MKGKRILSCLLAVMLLMGALPDAFAAQVPEVSLSSGTVEPGQSVTLTVTIKDNPGLAACMLYIYYDTSVFTVDPETDICAMGAFQRGGLVCNSIESAKQSGRYDGMLSEDGVLVLWYNGSGSNTTNNGNMLTITLHTGGDAYPGTYQIGLGYSQRDTNNAKEESVTLSTRGSTVTVTAAAGTTPSQPPVVEPEIPRFTDVPGNWAEAYIMQAAEKGLIIGDGNGKYRPDDNMTRAEFVTILWRAMGSPEPAKKSTFKDLNQEWQKKPAAWAEENGIVLGIGENRFDPKGNVTREQLVTILHRLAGEPTGMESLFTSVYDSQFSDSGKIRDWAKKAMYWSVYEEIYCGEESVSVGTELAPREYATRAQIAVMIVRYLERE